MFVRRDCPEEKISLCEVKELMGDYWLVLMDQSAKCARSLLDG